ncbi:enoyl-CoA hydratase [Nocardioides immobilis]|uniref:Enoyl-CoA hydratase n=1 Tax=Nocardioides immobilis TaxID=2049295 RepID=A0A417Y748_9ACTN|nr:enoyl-CoA hydratase [Nocardioides immobilis]RHW28331.1 enoyl-CoA hydratase [Nocardioides immobilis]
MVNEKYNWLTYDAPEDGVAVITLNRPRQRNAQHRGLLVELGEAFERAESDDEIRVVVLRGAGSTFSSGHDMGSADDRREREPGPGQHPTYRLNGGTMPGAVENTWLQEWHYYFANTRRWRDLRKVTIASVSGPVYSAGLMLMWACDLIVADETAEFADVVATRMGMAGVEYFAHPWEFGARRAKELLLTGDSLTADEGYRIGMVSKIFPAERLAEDTLAFARRIAKVPSAASLMIKEAVNQTQDHQGFYTSLNAAFTLHELNHAHWAAMSRGASLIQTPELGGTHWTDAEPVRPAERDRP